MDLGVLVLAFTAGLVLATAATPVGVSGAVLLLPVQLTLLGVPSPAVSPTNLLFNVVSVPGALARYQRSGRAWLPLAGVLLRGAIPGVVIGAVVRVLVLPDGTLFRALVAVLLAVLGGWLLLRERRGVPDPDSHPVPRLTDRAVSLLGLAAGLVGGVYGIGGGSLVAPVLILAGFAINRVAPAALVATFVTSVAGAVTFVVLAVTGHPESGPQWGIGLAAGLGGLIGGYLGAALQPRIPQRALRLGLAGLMLAIAAAYAASLVLR